MKKSADFLESKVLVLPKKSIFTDFNIMFPKIFIVVSDTESNPLRQYQIWKIAFIYSERNVTLKCGKIRWCKTLFE